MNSSIYGKFYSPYRALSFHRPFIVSIGSRSIGKTTGWLIWAVNRAINGNGEHKFVYLRRRQSDLDATASDALSNVEIIFHNNKIIPDSMQFIYEHGKYYAADGGKKVEIGSTQALSLATRKKSSAAGSLGYDLIIYDECICENIHDYIPKEYSLLMNFYITLARKVGESFNKDFMVVCIGNAASYSCPILEGIHADRYLTSDTKFLAPKGVPWLVEQTAQVEATKEGSDFLRAMLSETEYAYTTAAGTLDDNSLIYKLDCSHPVFACKFRGRYIGIYKEGDLTVCSSKRNQLPVIALTYDDGAINREYAPSRSSLGRLLKEEAERGHLVFSSQSIKKDILTYIKFI